MQVIVGKELDPEEYAMLRVPTSDAEEEDIRLFSETIKKRNEAKFREYVDGIYQVSISANRELYDRMIKEDPEMCDALKELMKDEFLATEISGAIKIYHEEMGLSPSEIEKKIIKRFGLDKKSAEEHITKTLRVELV